MGSLNDKFDAFNVFKKFKALAKVEKGVKLKGFKKSWR